MRSHLSQDTEEARRLGVGLFGEGSPGRRRPGRVSSTRLLNSQEASVRRTDLGKNRGCETDRDPQCRLEDDFGPF